MDDFADLVERELKERGVHVERGVKIPRKIRIQIVRCPACGHEGPSHELLEDWDGETYHFTCCGHRAHLDPDRGGAETWAVEGEESGE